jgi:hypothetical protein
MTRREVARRVLLWREKLVALMAKPAEGLRRRKLGRELQVLLRKLRIAVVLRRRRGLMALPLRMPGLTELPLRMPRLMELPPRRVGLLALMMRASLVRAQEAVILQYSGPMLLGERLP